jgi:Ergosterol biosynthesis ERG4/ERG24 family
MSRMSFLQTKRGTKLLTGGWWGLARKINYTGTCAVRMCLPIDLLKELKLCCPHSCFRFLSSSSPTLIPSLLSPSLSLLLPPSICLSFYPCPGDWLVTFSWCLLCGFKSPVPYFQAAYFLILLVHRWAHGRPNAHTHTHTNTQIHTHHLSTSRP